VTSLSAPGSGPPSGGCCTSISPCGCVPSKKGVRSTALGMEEIAQWKRLLQAAVGVRKLAPWRWMEETNIFGVQDPESGQVGFVSVMGLLGEHRAVAVYLGREALSRFWEFYDPEDYPLPEEIFIIPQLQLQFVSRADLTDRDLEPIRACGFRFRGAGNWPLFRSFRPGFHPWYLEPGEVRFLACCLEQLLEMAPRIHRDPEALLPGAGHQYLVRVPKKGDGETVWTDRVRSFPPLGRREVALSLPRDVIVGLGKLPKLEEVLEVDVFGLLHEIDEYGERPELFFSLLAVDASTGNSVEFRPIRADEALYPGIVRALLATFLRNASLPQEILVKKPRLYHLLCPLEELMGIQVELVEELHFAEDYEDFIFYGISPPGLSGE